MRISDWSSDVCSSDLTGRQRGRSARGRDHRGIALCGAAARAPQLLHRGITLGPRCQGKGAAKLIGLRRKGFGGLFLARRSEEHTSELQSLMRISYADFCLKKKIRQNTGTTHKDTKQ